MDETQPIGGYFELEAKRNSSELIHREAFTVNTSRNAFGMVLKNHRPKLLYLPYFLCDVVLEPILAQEIPVRYYSLNRDMSPQLDVVEEAAMLYYINYFGLFDSIGMHLSRSFPNRVCMDNAQAYFSPRIPKVSTFYSPRKFFGVPDGSFLYDEEQNMQLDPGKLDASWMEHLQLRKSHGPEAGYLAFKENEKRLIGLETAGMSEDSLSILREAGEAATGRIRNENFNVLHERYASENQFKFTRNKDAAALCYPLLLPNGHSIKDHLIKNKIFVPTYWPNVERTVSQNSWEKRLCLDLVCLPIDQRYGKAEMKRIIKCIDEFRGQ